MVGINTKVFTTNFLPPFHLKSDPSVAIEAEDDGTIYRGKIDVLAICDRL
jgi:hypothetical protein